jgi:aspartate racemase
MRTIGLIGGMSWQSSKTYYDRLNTLVGQRLGGLHSARLVMLSVDFEPIERMQAESRWQEAGEVLADAARKLEAAGADVVAIAANTMHKCAAQVRAATRLPLVHIGDALVKAMRADGRSRPLLLGTRYTMEDPSILRDHLGTKGFEPLIPDKTERDALHAIIFEELVKGVVTDEARKTVRAMIAASGQHEADSVIFGCTEIGMLFPPSNAGMPAYDTLECHCEALVDFALG